MKIKMKNEERGFVALISVILVSTVLLAAVLQNSAIAGDLFDEASHKQHRLFAVQSALVCLDHAVLEITHDYFFLLGYYQLLLLQLKKSFLTPHFST